MKKTLLIMALTILGIGQAFSQNYFIVNKTGTTAEYNMIDPSANVLLTSASGTLNDVLSTSVTIPFNFNYYGKTVTSFVASDNGYITFSSSETVSRPNQTALPDTSSVTPKNAIFAFWEDLQMLTDGNFPAQVANWTYGSAPNRVCVIQWRVMSPKGSTGDYAYFAIRLYEAGYFDVVHNYGHGNYACTVGCQNSDGTIGLSATGSPNIGLNWSNGNYDPTQSPVFEFHYATLPVDIVLTNPAIAAASSMYKRTVPTFVNGDQITFGGLISNYGTQTINSYTLNYSVDGGTPVTRNVTASLAAAGGAENLSIPNWTVAGPGKFHNIRLWISSVNGGALVDTSQYSASYNIFVINGGTNGIVKKPLLELGTGSWCGYCPNGHICLKNLTDNNATAVAVAYQNDDLMSTTAGDAINNTYVGASGFPSLWMDRHLFSGAPLVSLSNSGPNDNPAWDNDILTDLNTGSVPVSLGILTKTWDSVSRTINFTITGGFKDYVGGDIRLNAYIVEDNVRGADIESIEGGQMGWDQHNYYSSADGGGAAGAASDLYNEPYKIIGYVHNNVLRASLTGNWGVNLSGLDGSNAIATPNQTFSQSFTYKLPALVNVNYSKTVSKPDQTAYHNTFPGKGQNKPEDIRLVAFISMYNPNDPTYCEVLNAYQVPLIGWSAGIDPVSREINSIDLYPNPANSTSILTYDLVHSGQVSIEVYDMMGHKVADVQNGTQMAGQQSVNVNVSNLSNGLYFATITSNGVKAVQKFMVQK